MSVILIQGAEPSETEYLENKLEKSERIVVGGFTFTKGKYGNKDIVISRTKVGEINASAATSIGILEFKPEIIINQGTAGGHGKNIHKGDIVIGEKYIQINTFFSNYLEEGKGYDLDNWEIREYKSDEDYGNFEYNFASKELVNLAKETLPKLTKKTIHSGTIGSGDVWNREVDRILFLNNKYKTLCEEMETAGVYKIANSFSVPVLGIRIISNNEVLKEEYEPQIAKQCQEVIYNFIKTL